MCSLCTFTSCISFNYINFSCIEDKKGFSGILTFLGILKIGMNLVSETKHVLECTQVLLLSVKELMLLVND